MKVVDGLLLMGAIVIGTLLFAAGVRYIQKTSL
jgi:hypothetical protein